MLEQYVYTLLTVYALLFILLSHSVLMSCKFDLQNQQKDSILNDTTSQNLK